jgi:hypothetical protein
MRHFCMVGYLVVIVGFLCCGRLFAGTVWLLEPINDSGTRSIHRRFFNELALVLVQDEIYRRSDETTDFFALPPAEKVARAGALCGADKQLSVVWIEPDDSGVRRLGLVVATPNGKLARWIQFDAPVENLSDLAIIAGELIAHGRTFAETSTPRRDGWILVDPEKKPSVPVQSALSPSLLLDVEKPWERPEKAKETSSSRFSYGATYGFLGGIPPDAGPRIWMGGGVRAAFRPLKQLGLGVSMDIFGGVIPDSASLRVRGVQLAPAVSIGAFIDVGPFGVWMDLAGGPAVTRFEIVRTDQPRIKDRWLSARGRLELLLVLIPKGPLSILVGPTAMVCFPGKRYVEQTLNGNERVFVTALLSLGVEVGVTLKL